MRQRNKNFLLPTSVEQGKPIKGAGRIALLIFIAAVLIAAALISVGREQSRLRDDMRRRIDFFTRFAEILKGKDISDSDANDLLWLINPPFLDLLDRKKEIHGVFCLYDENKQLISSTPVGQPRELDRLDALAEQSLNGLPVKANPLIILMHGAHLVETNPPIYYAYVLEATPLPTTWREMLRWLYRALLWSMVLLGPRIWQKKRKDKEFYEESRRPPMNSPFLLTWLGQGGFAMNIAGKTIYLDPYMSDMVGKKEGLQRLVPPPLDPADARPDVYLVTHDHMDHLDTDFIKQMDCAGITFICPESCKTALLALGKGIDENQITVVNRGDTLELDGFALCAVYADHTPDSVGFVVTVNDLIVYFTGDTLYGDKVGAGVDADIICCCVNGKWGNMNAEEAVRVALRSGASVAIPNHYGMFAENTVDPAIFCAMAGAAGLKTYTMEHNETIDLTKLLR